jgi:hypothetical protein
MSTKYQTKPGKEGTLFLFRVAYKDRNDETFGVDVTCVWRYSIEHVYDAWNADGDSFEIVSISKVKVAK